MLLASVAAAAIASGAGGPAAVRVTATPSKAEVGLAEEFSVEVEGQGPVGTRWTFPENAGNEEVDLRPAAPGPAASGAMPSPGASTARYRAAAYALGSVQLPAVSVKYRLPDGTEGEATSAPVTLRVLSVLPKDPSDQKLADIRGPLSLSASRVFWATAVGALVLGTALGAWLLRRRRRDAGAAFAAQPVQAPDDEARAALDSLAVSEALARGEYRAFYIALSEVAKRYLERRLGAPVLEMTSAEMVAFLRDHAPGHGLLGSMRDLAAAADHVKFARGSAVAAEAQRHLASVRQMIDLLEARLLPSPSDTPGEKVA